VLVDGSLHPRDLRNDLALHMRHLRIMSACLIFTLLDPLALQVDHIAFATPVHY
jgi:hypothetical protein